MMKINPPSIGQSNLTPLDLPKITEEPSIQKSQQYTPQSSIPTVETVNTQPFNSASTILMEIAQNANLNDPTTAAIAIKAATEQIIRWQLNEEFKNRKNRKAWEELTEDLAELIGGEDGDPNLKKKIFSILSRMKKKGLEHDVR